MDDKTTGVGDRGERGESMEAERIAGRGDESVIGREGVSPRARTRTSAARVESRMTGSVAAPTRTPGAAPEAPEQRTREIRSEIEQTREEMSETVNAIQDRLRPRNIASNAADSVRQAAGERVRDVADSEFVQGLRANPVPTAMVGIGIAGLAWLAFGGGDSRRRRTRDRGRTSRDWSTVPSYRQDDEYYGELESDRDRDYAAAPGGRSDEGITEQVTRGVQRTTRRAQTGLERTWQRNPLLIGAASAVVGALVGLAVPETERENELMGETRDNMVEGVEQMARDTAKKVQDAAATAVDLVTDKGKQNP